MTFNSILFHSACDYLPMLGLRLICLGRGHLYYYNTANSDNFVKAKPILLPKPDDFSSQKGSQFKMFIQTEKSSTLYTRENVFPMECWKPPTIADDVTL